MSASRSSLAWIAWRRAPVLPWYCATTLIMSVRDVAETLGTSENTVKTQLREALAQMRTALAEDGETPEASHA